MTACAAPWQAYNPSVIVHILRSFGAAFLLMLLPVGGGAANAGPAQTLCKPDAPPLVIDAAGTYDWTCGGSHVSGNDAAITVNASNVTLIGPVAHDSRHCIRIAGADRVRIQGGRLSRCRKFGIIFDGPSDDVTIENVTIEDSGNGITAYTRGNQVHRRLRLEGNVIRRMGGSVDGHGIGMQTVQDSVVAHNIIEHTQMAAISMYWWNGTTVQSGNRIEHNVVINQDGQGIYLGGNNGEGTGRYDNLVRFNTISARQPLYLKGNRTPGPQQWAIEAVGNRLDGPLELGRSGRDCGRLRIEDNIGVTAIVGACRHY